MKTNPLKDGAITENSAGIGTVTRGMVRDRAVELAAIDGRPSQQVSKTDWEQAKQELTGDSTEGSIESKLESAPESDRWNPLSGSAGRQAEAAPSEDEDEEGRSDNERLTNEGLAGADDDQRRKAAQAASGPELSDR